MATILREWSYRYQWLYDSISRFAALAVGGESRFRQLALQGLNLSPEMQVLDLCCGSGQATHYLVQRSDHVTGLDASPRSLQRAKHNVPQATYIQGFAENMPFADRTFDLVHISAALHEMEPAQLHQILQEIKRVLKSGGTLAIVDFHSTPHPLVWPGLATFLLLFETETAWQFLQTDLAELLNNLGLTVQNQVLYAAGTLQVIQSQK